MQFVELEQLFADFFERTCTLHHLHLQWFVAFAAVAMEVASSAIVVVRIIARIVVRIVVRIVARIIAVARFEHWDEVRDFAGETIFDYV